jgi:hypothetical protein
MSAFWVLLALPAVFGGDDLGEANDRRHGWPLEVIPRQVVAGFFESERDTLDSGVLLKYGMGVVITCALKGAKLGG